MFREVPLLMKVGVIMMALALALVIAAVVVSAALRSEPERLVAAEVATKSPGEAPRNSSGEEGSASKKSSSEKDAPHYPSREESLGYGSFSSRGTAGQQKEEAETPKSQSEMPQPAGQQSPSEAPSEPESQPHKHQPQPQEQPLPGSEGRGWPEPTRGEVKRANQERRYELLPGAIMGLTIEDIGIYGVPVFDSDGRWALANGVAHNPQTSLPWSQSAQRNVYLAGHRMGYRGTWSRMIFYNLPKLNGGEEVLLKDRVGRSYRYRVSEVFIADPTDVWVMGQVRGGTWLRCRHAPPTPPSRSA